jgi:DNA end-binding protein Ku
MARRRARSARDREPSPRRHAFWRGTLTFGLVSVPVSLHRAIARRSVAFHELHDQDGGRILHRTVCSVDGAAVPREHIVKGFEIERGRWITVSTDELRALAPVASRTIEIVEFVDPLEIDPIFYEQTYWLVPDEGAARAYATLATAMAELRRVAVARLTLRARQHLSAIRASAQVGAARGPVLALSTLGYADEILPIADLAGLDRTEEPPGERELSLAERLIDALSGHFQPERYHDEQRDKVLAYLRQKTESATPEATREPTPAPPPADLFGALEASVSDAEHHKTAA